MAPKQHVAKEPLAARSMVLLPSWRQGLAGALPSPADLCCAWQLLLTSLVTNCPCKGCLDPEESSTWERGWRSTQGWVVGTDPQVH